MYQYTHYKLPTKTQNLFINNISKQRVQNEINDKAKDDWIVHTINTNPAGLFYILFTREIPRQQCQNTI